MSTNEVTLKQIENLRKKLMILGNEKGFTHIETVLVSQALDCLLNEYTKINYKRLLKEG